MAELKITDCELLGIKIIEPACFEDFRGYFCETYSSISMAQYGISTVFTQDCHSFSKKKGTLRGIHFQNEPFSQEKIVRCTKGSIMDVIIDLRKKSNTYKKHIYVNVSESNCNMVYIPKGFGHAFITLEDNTIVNYKISGKYLSAHSKSIRWNDPEININWGNITPILSENDANAPYLSDSDINY